MLSLASEGDLPMAGSRARDMVERAPDSGAAFAALGSILVREGLIADAQQAFFKALSLEPDDAFNAYNLAVALDRLHKPVQALGYYERALALADKFGAATRRNFPRDAVVLRIGQIKSVGDASTTTAPPTAQK
jgi:Flp pilus assembly protein TadD